MKTRDRRMGWLGVLAGGWVLLGCGLPSAWGAEGEFDDVFRGALGKGWSWVREDPAGWRTTDAGLEIRVQPGNLWGGSNNARNVLVRAAPDPADRFPGARGGRGGGTLIPGEFTDPPIRCTPLSPPLLRTDPGGEALRAGIPHRAGRIKDLQTGASLRPPSLLRPGP